MGYKELLQKTKGEEYLAEPKNEIQLSEKLDRLISDEKLRKEMGEWGLEEVQKYSWEKVADRVLEFYKKCHTNN
jgi:glycosyltransferase involved in cell wall biosynthesis